MDELTYDKALDSIVSVPAGVIGTREIACQNRATFQQVVQYTAHRPRTAPAAAPRATAPGPLPATGAVALLPLLGALLIGAGLVAVRRGGSRSESFRGLTCPTHPYN